MRTRRRSEKRIKNHNDRPHFVVAKVVDGWDGWRAKVLHKDLISLDFLLEGAGKAGLQEGDFVRAEPVGCAGKRLKFIEKVDPAGAATLAAICNHGLLEMAENWADSVLADVGKLAPYRWEKGGERVDFRRLAVVTIDGADARDFDDAVWAEQLPDGTFNALVAIADVAHYVKPGTALDREALRRGNSTYFPDRVIPMLPERLSNDLCSLKPGVDRPVLAVEMTFSADGELRKWRFARGVIHSAARLTYEEAEGLAASAREVCGSAGSRSAPASQALISRAGLPEGEGLSLRGNKKSPLPCKVSPEVLKTLGGLFALYAAMAGARVRRGALDLDIPEVKLELGPDGRVANVGVRQRLASHKLIEELMIAANVAAAEALSRNGGGLYRVHAEPTKEKLLALKATLGPLGFTVPAPNAGPKGWAKLVAQMNGHPAAQTLMRAVLQSQQQARYDPANIGHYGLALPLYAHFTSPIRRYADLVVHRALLEGIGSEGLRSEGLREADLGRVAEVINATERRSQMAEWEARDRLVAQHFEGLVGKTFPAVVVGVQPFGCFVAVEGVAEGLLPKWDLRGWVYVGGLNCFRKVKGGKGVLRIGSRLDVVLREADALGGRLTFGLRGDG